MNAFLHALTTFGFEYLRANVTNRRTFGGHGYKIKSAHVLTLGRPQCETNHCIVRLAEYLFVSEKIDNNRIPTKYRF